MGSLFGDIRLAIRRLRRSPGFTISALLILILSIGANSTIFTVVNRYLLQPLPVERPNDLVTLNYRSGTAESPTLSYPDYRDVRDRSRTLEGLAAFQLTAVSTSYSGNNRRSWAYLVSPNYLELLGVKAFMGRSLTSSDDGPPGANPVVMLSYGFWQGHFGGDPGIVGATMKLNGSDYAVIGIMPKGFYGTERIFTPDVFAPLSMQPALAPGSLNLENRRARGLFVIGRLKPGVPSASAQAEVSGIASQLAREYPADDENMEVILSPAGLFGTLLRGPLVAASVLLLVLAGGVLLVGCANVAGLLLARSAARRKETAIRLAVGATRGTLIREVMVESLVLNVLAGLGGVALAFWLRDLIAGWAPPIPVPLIPDFEMDLRVLGLSVLASLAAGVLCGIAPSLQSARSSVAEALKQTRRRRFGRWHMQDLLVGGQVALSMVLLMGSLLVADSLGRTLDINLGFEPERGASVAVNLAMEGYNGERARTFRRDLLERARALPGVESAALAGGLPLALEANRGQVAVEGQPPVPASQAPVVSVYFSGEGYFRTMGTRLIAGREFEERDETSNVVIVNQTFARKLLAGRDPMGARIRIDASPWLEIVGVAEDGKYIWINEDSASVAFLPIRNSPGMTTIVAKGSMDPGVLVGQLRSTVLGMDPAITVFYDGPLTRRVDFQLLPSRFLAISLGSFGVVAMLLVGAGLYGILAYAVTQRTKEIGIRMALGAAPGSVVRTIVARAATLAGVGIVVGVAGGLALGKLFSQVLYGINPYDPVTICAAVAVMALVGLIACWLPVRRATRVDPLTALRAE